MPRGKSSIPKSGPGSRPVGKHSKALGRPTKAPGRRPALLERPDISPKFIEALRVGTAPDIAAQYVGVHPATIFRWRERGRRDREGPFYEFERAVQQALAEYQTRLCTALATSGLGSAGEPFWEYERDETGAVRKDATGAPIVLRDSEGEKVPMRDESGRVQWRRQPRAPNPITAAGNLTRTARNVETFEGWEPGESRSREALAIRRDQIELEIAEEKLKALRSGELGTAALLEQLPADPIAFSARLRELHLRVYGHVRDGDLTPAPANGQSGFNGSNGSAKH